MTVSPETEQALYKAKSRYAVALWTVFAVVICVVLASLYFSIQQQALIKDCTTPGGKCYQRGQENGARFVQQIVKECAKNDEKH